MATTLKTDFSLRGGDMILVPQPAGDCINYYAVNKKWLRDKFPEYFENPEHNNRHSKGISLTDRIIAMALLEKKMGFMFRPYCAHPFTFPLQDGKADTCRAFADLLAQLLNESGQYDAAKMVDAMMDYSTEN